MAENLNINTLMVFFIWQLFKNTQTVLFAWPRFKQWFSTKNVMRTEGI